MNKYKNNKLLDRVYQEGLDKGITEGTKLAIKLLEELPRELDETIKGVPGIGEKLNKRIVEAVQNKADEMKGVVSR